VYEPQHTKAPPAMKNAAGEAFALKNRKKEFQIPG